MQSPTLARRPTKAQLDEAYKAMIEADAAWDGRRRRYMELIELDRFYLEQDKQYVSRENMKEPQGGNR